MNKKVILIVCIIFINIPFIIHSDDIESSKKPTLALGVAFDAYFPTDDIVTEIYPNSWYGAPIYAYITFLQYVRLYIEWQYFYWLNGVPITPPPTILSRESGSTDLTINSFYLGIGGVLPVNKFEVYGLGGAIISFYKEHISILKEYGKVVPGGHFYVPWYDNDESFPDSSFGYFIKLGINFRIYKLKKRGSFWVGFNTSWVSIPLELNENVTDKELEEYRINGEDLGGYRIGISFEVRNK